MVEKQTFPRIPESNWWTLRNQFHKTLPTSVTTSYLKSLLNLTTDVAASNLLSPLKQIGLIDDEGKPTPRATNWRSDTKYSETCKEIIKEVYPSELIELYSGSNLNKNSIKEWFKNTTSLGEVAAGQCASMYILLQEAKINLDDNNIKKAQKIVKPNTKPQQKKSQTQETVSNKSIQKVDEIPNIHINLQIHISPEANADQIESIFANVAKYLYRK